MTTPTPTYNYTGILSVNGLALPGNVYQPQDHGLLAWAYDPAVATASTATVSGTIYLTQLLLRSAQTVSKLAISIASGASGVTANQNFLGLYNSSGNLVASTAVGAIDSQITSPGALIANVATPYAAPAGAYWVALLNNATTPLQTGRTSTFASTPNIGLGASQYRFCVAGTAQTSLPSLINPASNSLSSIITMWAAAA